MNIKNIKPKKKVKGQSGFTLIELLLYVGISATIMLTTVIFLQILLESNIKNQTIAEVEQQGLQVMQIITQTIRNADSIILPPVGGRAETLRLEVVNAANSPTIFDLSEEGIIRMTEGAGSPITLTNSRITVSSLSFENLSREGTPGIVRLTFTLARVNPSGRQEYEFNKTFYTSASLRQP